MREAFEAAALAYYLKNGGDPYLDILWKTDNGSYGVAQTNAAWWGWLSHAVYMGSE